MTEYRRVKDHGGRLKPGEVVGPPSNSCVTFTCPCSEGRSIYISGKFHGIEFDDKGRLTLKGSIGSREDKEKGYPRNWCHLDMTDGKVRVYLDAKCPGRECLEVIA